LGHHRRRYVPRGRSADAALKTAGVTVMVTVVVTVAEVTVKGGARLEIAAELR